MTYVVALLLYESIYNVLYLSPLVLALLLPDEWRSLLGPVFVIPIIGMFLLAGYRSHLAARAYGERDMGFWEAHSVSGQTLKLHLSFLPVIGRWFRNGDSP